MLWTPGSANAYKNWCAGLEKKGYRQWQDGKERKVFAKLTGYWPRR